MEEVMRTIQNTKEAKVFTHNKKLFRRIKHRRWEIMSNYGWAIVSKKELKNRLGIN
jgi:hypothetical protein